MKKTVFGILAAAVIAAFIAAFSGCSKDVPKLYVYTWADYIDPDLIEKFQEENNCQVIIDTFDSNETMYAKLLAGAAGYDIIMPTEYIMNQLIAADLIDKIDVAKVPNAVKNFDKMFETEWSMKYDVPYAFSCTGILYRKDKFPAGPDFNDWNDMFNLKQERICMMNDIREVIGLALKMSGYSVNSVNPKEIEEATELAIKWKKACTKMDNEAYRTGIPAGEFHVSMAYNSDAIMLLADDAETIGYTVPTNGTASSIDVFCVMKKSTKKDLAHKFIDMFYEMPNAVKNSEYNGTPMPVVGLYDNLSDKYKAIPYMKVTEELKARCEDIKDVGEGLELYSKAWDKVLSAK